MSTFHTGFYSPKAKQIFIALRKKLLDKAGRYTWFYRALDGNEVNESDDGQVVLSSSYTYTVPEQKFFETFAIKIKELTRATFGSWDRNDTEERTITISKWYDYNNTVIEDVKMTVRDLYFIYETLLRRARLNANYPTDYAKEFVGQPLDPILSQMRLAQREEKKKLEDELEAKKCALDSEKYEERNAFYIQLNEKYKALETQLEAEYAKKIQDLVNSMEAMINLGAPSFALPA